MPHAQKGNICPSERTIMATRGIASSPPSISSFSPSGNSFSIKNILNLSDETVISRDAAPVDAFDKPCPAPSLLVAPRAVFPPGYHSPHLSFGLPGFCSLPSPRPVVQITPFIFPNDVGSFGMNVPKKRRRPMKKKKLRPLFSAHQIQTMEKEFEKCRYITESRRAELASDLNLTEMQVKTWFQNRRTKWKKETQVQKGAQLSEMQLFCGGNHKQGFFGTNTTPFSNADCIECFVLF